MIELSSYGCKFTCGDGAWAVSGTVARVARDAPASDPTPEPHTWSHEDILIANPRKPTPLPPGVSAHTLLIHFDGSYKDQVGAGSFLLWGQDGTCLGGKGLSCADAQARMTHNVAAVWAARDCLAYIEEQLLIRQHKAILISRDS